MPASNFTKNVLLNHCFGQISSATVSIATIYFGLSTTEVIATSTGATVAEPPTADGYARIAFTNNQSGHWSNSTAETLNNSGEAVTFAESTDIWGDIVSLFIADSGTRAAGNILWYTTLLPSLSVGDNTVVDFGAGTIIVTL
jgi:hypothetical protein